MDGALDARTTIRTAPSQIHGVLAGPAQGYAGRVAAHVPAGVITTCATVADADSRGLRARLLDALRPAVPFDAHVWVVTDPETSVGVAPLARVPPVLMARLPELIRLRYLSRINRWTELGDSAASWDDPSATADGWTALLRRHDIGDVASLNFADRHGCWGFLDLWRSSGSPGFSTAERAVLSGARGPITAALRMCQARGFAAHPRRTGAAGPVVLLLTPALEIVGQTPAAPGLLDALMPATGHAPTIPAAAYNVAAQLLATEAGVDTNPPRARVHLAAGTWVTLRAARVRDGRPRDDQTIAVTIEVTDPGGRADLFARAHGLTRRERDLLDRLCAGGDTRHIASEMFLSTHTVQDHLKSIFAKAAVNSRRELLARALGG